MTSGLFVESKPPRRTCPTFRRPFPCRGGISRRTFSKTVGDPYIVYYGKQNSPSCRPSLRHASDPADTSCRPKLIATCWHKEARLDFVDDGLQKDRLAKLRSERSEKKNHTFPNNSSCLSCNLNGSSGRQISRTYGPTSFLTSTSRFHNFITPSIAAILPSGARKFGCGLHLGKPP